MTPETSDNQNRYLSFFAALTIAALFLFTGWRNLSSSLWWGAVERDVYRAVTYSSFAFCYSLIAVIAFVIFDRAGRGSYGAQRYGSAAGSLLLAVLVVNCVRQIAGIGVRELAAFLSQPLVSVTVLLLLFLLAMLAFHWPRSLWRALITTLAAFSPFSAVQAATLWWQEISVTSAATEVPVLRQASRTSSRLLIVVFDELDADEIRTNLPLLPGFRSLLARSTSFSKVIAPSELTLISLPSMFTGQHIDSVHSIGSFRVWIRGQQAVAPFAARETLFGDVAAAGIGSSVAGWYLPYCSDDFALPVVSCAHFANSTVPKNFLGGIVYFLGAGWGEWSLTRDRTRIMNARRAELHGFLRRTTELALEKNTSLVFLHFPIPHLPSRFDRTIGDFRTRASYESDETQYLDNLVLADRILAKLVTDLDENHLLDEGWLVVTGDHGFRKRQPFENYIPLIVRAPEGALVGVDSSSVSPTCLRRFVRSVFQHTERSAQEHLSTLRYADTTRRAECL